MTYIHNENWSCPSTDGFYFNNHTCAWQQDFGVLGAAAAAAGLIMMVLLISSTIKPHTSPSCLLHASIHGIQRVWVQQTYCLAAATAVGSTAYLP